MMKLTWLVTLVTFAAGCSGAGAEQGSNDVQQGAKVTASTGLCDPLDPNGPAPTCREIPGDGAAGAPAVVDVDCSAVDVAPNGVCSAEPCDPDCIVDPVVGPDGTPIVDDPCAAVDSIPDGVCSEQQCDPDCKGPDGTPIVDDPCAAVDSIPDGVCSGLKCDPDCKSK